LKIGRSADGCKIVEFDDGVKLGRNDTDLVGNSVESSVGCSEIEIGEIDISINGNESGLTEGDKLSGEFV
jgi:hypothetical protein